MAAPIPFRTPAWVAAHADPVVDAMLAEFDDPEWDRLYRVYLADEVHSGRPAGIFPPAWHALARVCEHIRRRNREGLRL